MEQLFQIGMQGREEIVDRGMFNGLAASFNYNDIASIKAKPANVQYEN